MGCPGTFSETVLKDASLKEAKAFLLMKFNLYTGLNCLDWEAACAVKQTDIIAEEDSLQLEDILYTLIRNEQ